MPPTRCQFQGYLAAAGDPRCDAAARVPAVLRHGARPPAGVRCGWLEPRAAAHQSGRRTKLKLASLGVWTHHIQLS